MISEVVSNEIHTKKVESYANAYSDFKFEDCKNKYILNIKPKTE